MSSYKLSELKAQIAQLQREEAEIIKNERIAIIKEIKDKLEAYNITIEELQRKGKPAAAKSPSVIKYRKDEHNFWVGRGPKPQWVKAVEANGESLEQYRVTV
jgi:DNA-binding protein H-NS